MWAGIAYVEILKGIGKEGREITAYADGWLRVLESSRVINCCQIIEYFSSSNSTLGTEDLYSPDSGDTAKNFDVTKGGIQIHKRASKRGG